MEADPSRPCPFCPGNEEATPPALETYDRDGLWNIRVVPNLYPAFYGHGRLGSASTWRRRGAKSVGRSPRSATMVTHRPFNGLRRS